MYNFNENNTCKSYFYYDTIMVHGGTFHADDIMTVAICKVIDPKIRVERVNRVPDEVPGCTLVADIGLGEFDHHQPDARVREDGHKYAACGLVFEEYGHHLFSEEGCKYFENTYIRPIEDQDNGVSRNPLSAFIGSMNPSWDDDNPDSMFIAFNRAVDFCVLIVKEAMRVSKSMDKANDCVFAAVETMKENGLVVLPKYLPPSLFVCSGVKLIVAPSNRGGYNILTIKVSKDTMEDVISLPEAWLSELPEGCRFVHPARFIAAFDTEKQAVSAANSVLA